MGTIDRERLREAIKIKGTTPRALSKEVGDNAYLVRDILSGKSQNPRSDTLSKLAQALGVSLADITTDTGNAQVSGVNYPSQLTPQYLPVRYRVQAGLWYEVDNFVDEFPAPPQPVTPDPRFDRWPQWLEQVEGDSANKRFPPGCWVRVIDAVAMGYAPQHNHWVVVERRRDGGALRERTIKQVEIRSDGTVLLWPRSTSPAWSEPVVMDGGAEGEEIEVEIVGRVTGYYEDVT